MAKAFFLSFVLTLTACASDSGPSGPGPIDPGPTEALRWVGGSGSWHDSANWAPARVPTDQDEVVIDAPGSVVDIADDAVARAITLAGELSWTAGELTVQEELGVQRDGELRAASSELLMVSAQLNNEGYVELSPHTTVDLSGGFDNRPGASLVLGARSQLRSTSGTTFVSEGMLRHGGGDDPAYLSIVDPTMQVAGDVQVDEGRLAIQNAATWTASIDVAAGAALELSGGTLRSDVSSTGAGSVVLSQETVIQGLVGLANVEMASGTLRGDQLHVTGTMKWRGGSLSALTELRIDSGAVLEWSGANGLVTASTLVNAGSVEFLGTRGRVGLGGVIRNEGEWNHRRGSFEDGPTGVGQFQNAGLFVHWDDSGNKIGVDFENTGTLDLRDGMMDFEASFRHEPDAVLTGGGNEFGLNANGRIRTQESTSQLFAGTIDPQLPSGPASLDIIGPATFAPTTVVRLDLAEPGGGEFSEQLGVAFGADLAGTLEAAWAFTPSPGHAFIAMKYGSVTGDFDALQAPGFGVTKLPTQLLLEWP